MGWKKVVRVIFFVFVILLNGFSLLVSDKLKDLVERVNVSATLFTFYMVLQFVVIVYAVFLLFVTFNPFKKVVGVEKPKEEEKVLDLNDRSSIDRLVDTLPKVVEPVMPKVEVRPVEPKPIQEQYTRQQPVQEPEYFEETPLNDDELQNYSEQENFQQQDEFYDEWGNPKN